MALQVLIPYIDDPAKFPYKDETINWKSEAGTLVNLLWRAADYHLEMAAKYREIYTHFNEKDDIFCLTYLRP